MNICSAALIDKLTYLNSRQDLLPVVLFSLLSTYFFWCEFNYV